MFYYIYIKYNTISFLVFLFVFLLLSFCTQKYPKYTDTPLNILQGPLLYKKRQFQLIILA